MLSRDLTLESEVLAVVVVGVVVRGVEAAEFVEDARGLVGDLVGDCSNQLQIEWFPLRNVRAMTVVIQDVTQSRQDFASCALYLLQCHWRALA